MLDKEVMLFIITERLAREMASLKFGELDLQRNPHLFKMDEDSDGLPYVLIDEVQEFFDKKEKEIRNQLKVLL